MEKYQIYLTSDYNKHVGGARYQAASKIEKYVAKENESMAN